MRELKLAAVLMAVASSATAQVMNTDCNQFGSSVNCTTMGPGGLQSTDCNRFGPSVNCTTMGNAYPAPEPHAADPNAGAGAAAGAVAVAGLGLLAWKGAQAVHQHRTQDRAKRVAVLVTAHDCEAAVALAQKENDPVMASRVPELCRTKQQVGMDPPFLVEAATPADVAGWAKLNIQSAPGSSFLSATRDELDLRQPSTAPAGSIWIREEALSAAGEHALGGRSKLMLVAFDCAQATFSIRASTAYLGQNLSGEGRSNDHPSDTVAIRPGSMSEAWEKKACTAMPAAAQPVSIVAH